MLHSKTHDGGTTGRPPHPEGGASPEPGSTSEPDAAIRHDDPARAAVRALARLAPDLGWGLLICGGLWGASRAIGRVAEGPATSSIVARAVLEASAIVLASGLAGRAAAMACRHAGAVIIARLDRSDRAEEALERLAPRAVEALERLAEALERRPISGTPAGPSDHDRGRLLGEIAQAVHSGRRDEADGLLDAFDARFPGDPAIPDLRERLAAARRDEVERHVAQIEAARQVNDADRVLELYRAVASALELDRRGDLERRLARWFLELIHRRLRGGRIQVDVVHLATKVADAFGATVEGASLRASLPTLRRSVGLCPRCAQPYVGTANACPQCLATPSSAPAPGGTDPDPSPDAEPEASEPPHEPGDGHDDGWLRYNEDDGEPRGSPA